MLNTVFFEFGRTPELSYTETLLCYPQLILVESNRRVLLAQAHDSFDFRSAQERLAGIVKTGEIIREYTRKPSWLEIQNLMIEHISKHASQGKKIEFGLSILDESYETTVKELNQLGMTIKRLLKEKNYSVRHIMNKERILSSAAIAGSKLLSEYGFEFVLLKVKGTWYLGRTKTVQPFAAYSERDYGRPGRDDKSGMLPPKLARMMLNLAGKNPAQSAVLDPFCGSGTIVQEAALLKFQRVTGTDKSEISVKQSEQNIGWLFKQNILRAEKNKTDIQVQKCDVRNLQNVVHTGSIDAIVTEPYMGIPLKGNEPRELLAKQARELLSLYAEAFTSFEKIIKPNGTVVFVLPHFEHKGSFIRVPLMEKLAAKGWRAKYLPRASNEPFFFFRDGQKIKREILVLEKVSNS